MLARIPWRRAGRILLKTIALILGVPLSYFAAALILGLVPANVTWHEAERGITIFVRTNGVHTWIMMPTVNEYMDWRPYAPGEHLRNPRYGAGNYVAIGYGNRDFYLNTPTWGDLELHTALSALAGRGTALLHVEHEHDPRPSQWQRPITLRSEEYRRLVAFIRERFKLGPDGHTIPLLGRGYRDWDMFYEANGGYSLILTCNEWTGRALRAAGVRTGLWTPLEQSVMWRL
ncbi:MAG TPA: TIGR02117 family protein [Allosphingosinicella sp.]|jgi:uncharacterized protein (TIGR02117 family)|nr:TIGR02117 family protein [Allosphingosinicella sp.]